MIRFAVEADLEEMLEIYRPFVEQTAVSFEYTLPSLEAFRQRFREHVAQFPWLVWQEGERVLAMPMPARLGSGAAYRWCAESSVYLAPQAGAERSRALYARLEEILTAQGYRVLYALVTTANAPVYCVSRGVGLRRRAEFPDCGYKLGQWHGVVWLEKRLVPLGNPSSFPQLPDAASKST